MVTSDPNPQAVIFSAWENVSLTVTRAQNGSISGQTLQLNIRDESGNVVLVLNSVTNSGQFNVVQAGSSTTPGIFSFDLTSAETGDLLIGPGEYRYDIWRVDSGAEKRLTWGPMSVLGQQWK